MEKIIVATQKDKHRTKNYLNKYNFEIRPRHIRDKIVSGKKLTAWYRDEQETTYTIYKENKEIVVVKEVEIEKEVSGELVKIPIPYESRYSERIGYKKMWTILDECKGYAIWEDD
jgi:hypothetical protein